MSNRQERRAAKAMARRASKGMDGLSRSIIEQASLWAAGEELDLDAMGINDPRFDATLYGMTDDLADLLGDEFPDFSNTVKDEAMLAVQPVQTEEGQALYAVPQMFFVPVIGSELAISGLVTDTEDLSWLAKSFRQYELAHNQSNVRLLQGFVTAKAAAKLMPGQIRKAAMELLKVSTVDVEDGPKAGETEKRILDIIDGKVIVSPTQDTEEPVHIAADLLIGVRTLFVDAREDVHDEKDDYFSYFMSPELYERLATEEDELEHETETEDLDREANEWFEAADTRFGQKGIIMDLPEQWAASLGSLGRTLLSVALGVEKEKFGIDPDAVADIAHLRHDEWEFRIRLKFGEHLVGPITIPNELVLPDYDRFMDEVDALAKEFQRHSSDETFVPVKDGPGEPNTLH